jgi:hypothetical protein
VEFGEHGIKVDEHMRTTSARIYAIGDVASKYRFTHAADAQARMVVRNALFFGRGKAADLVIPWCTYTSPEVAHVGITAAEAKEQGAETITIPMREVDRARLDGEEDGFLRVHLKPARTASSAPPWWPTTRGPHQPDHPGDDRGHRAGQGGRDHLPLPHAGRGHPQSRRRVEPHPPHARREEGVPPLLPRSGLTPRPATTLVAAGFADRVSRPMHRIRRVDIVGAA